MSKSSYCILALLITFEVNLHVSCIGFNSWRHFAPRGTFFLNPSPDEEYASPAIPINLFKLHQRRPFYNEPANRPESKEIQRPWIPSVRNSRGFAPVTRHTDSQFRRPISYRDRAVVSAASPSVVTAEPQTFDIPLKKSIRVSNSALNRSAIQTTGYIKDTVVRKFPQSRTTQSPRHKIMMDNLKQTTAQSKINATEFDDSWKPKRILYLKPSVKPANLQKPGPMQFTRFSGSKIEDNQNSSDEQKNKENILPENSMRPSPVYSIDKTLKQLEDNRPHVTYLNENLDSHDSLPLNPSYTQNSKENKGNGLKYFDERTLLPQNNNEGTSTNTKGFVKLSSNNTLPGVLSTNSKEGRLDQSSAYKRDEKQKDESEKIAMNKLIEINNPTHDNIFFQQYPSVKTADVNRDRNAKLIILDPQEDSHGNISPKLETNSFNQQNKFKTHLPVIPSGQKINLTAFIEYDTSKPDDIDASKFPTNTFSTRNQSRVNIQNFSKIIPTLNVAHLPANKNKEPESVFDVKHIYPNTPFYGDVSKAVHSKEHSKEIKEDVIYFPQNFPNYRQPQGTNTNVNSSSSLADVFKSVQIPTTPVTDKERLVEFNSKRAEKNRNVVTNHQNGGRGSSHFPLPNAVTTKDFFSFIQKANTPPSLITVSSDNLDGDHPFLDPNRSRNKVNRTDNYILQRKPSLLPDIPGTYKPRKPNVRLTTGMLAGILIAALIFLGFLTGTMVFAFHQLKFGGKPKKDRHKKRTTVYAPEYLDENFAGNTYIHNNIFLPNPQNLEDRLSTEMDTTFSVDSEETAQVTDRPSTSGGNTRNKPRDE